MKNKLSVFYEHIFDAEAQSAGSETIESLLHFSKDCGIDYLECDLARLAKPKETKAIFDSCGMGVSSIYYFYDLIHDTDDLCRKKWHTHLETAAELGSKMIMCIPGFICDADEYAESVRIICHRLNMMCSDAEKYGITVTMEDFDDKTSPCSTAAGLKYFAENVPDLGITFDTGNFRYSLEDAFEAYDLLRSRIVHFHCKDRTFDISNALPDKSNGKADLSGGIMYPAPVCEGIIGIDKLVKNALIDNYSGIFTIEHFGAANQKEYIRRSAENLISLPK